MKKSILCTNLEVDTEGYYEFNNNISLEPGGFAYKKVDASQKGLRRDYKSTNVLAINISSSKINAMSEKDKFRLSFTLSVLLNEAFETLFSNIKQYILVRSVVSDNSNIADLKENELVNLYRPIVDANVENGINIYITEDTELERGITDAIANNFDNIVMKVLFDYLFWITQENDAAVSDKWFMSPNGDYINAETIDKLKFLKYGGENLNEVLDLNLAYECLRNLILDGNDTLTYSRAQVLGHRYEKNPFKNFVEAVESKTENESKDELDKNPNKKKAKKNSNSKQTVEEIKKNVTDSDVVDASTETTIPNAGKEPQKDEPKEEKPKVGVPKPEAAEAVQQTVNEEKKGLFQKMKEKFKAKTPQSNDTATEVKKAETVVEEKKSEQ